MKQVRPRGIRVGSSDPNRLNDLKENHKLFEEMRDNGWEITSAKVRRPRIKNGETSYIPMCNTVLKPGNTLKADDIRIVTLFMKPDYIFRAVEKWNAPRCESRRLHAFKKALWYKVLKPIRDLQWKIQGKKAIIFEDLTLY